MVFLAGTNVRPEIILVQVSSQRNANDTVAITWRPIPCELQNQEDITYTAELFIAGNRINQTMGLRGTSFSRNELIAAGLYTFRVFAVGSINQGPPASISFLAGPGKCSREIMLIPLNPSNFRARCVLCMRLAILMCPWGIEVGNLLQTSKLYLIFFHNISLLKAFPTSLGRWWFMGHGCVTASKDIKECQLT